MWYDYRRGPSSDWRQIQSKQNWTDVDFVGCYSKGKDDGAKLKEALEWVDEETLR